MYRDRKIHFKTKPMELKLKGRRIVMSFNILLLKKDKAVLGMPFLQKYNLRINWIIKNVKL